jgi:hypothetical protein
MIVLTVSTWIPYALASSFLKAPALNPLNEFLLLASRQTDLSLTGCPLSSTHSHQQKP